jgi:hypothetical protein
MQKPSLGRVVIVPTDPNMNNGSDEAYATITRVWSDVLVNIRVTGDSPSSDEWRTSVTLVAEKPEDAKHVAWWPPRV